MPRTVRRGAAMVGAAVLSCVAWSAPAGAAPGTELHLTFETTSARTNAGTTAMRVGQLSYNGGTITRTTGSYGAGIRLPAYRASSPPLAVLTAVDTSGRDVLSPGTSTFVFGADFAIDSVSQGSSTDNGNNLIQRGLFSAPMQYKIEVDGRRPACRIKGSQGAVAVRSSYVVTPGIWYRATCSRSGTTVTLQLTRVSDGATITNRRSGATGSLRAPSASLPLSVGGKVTARGSIAVRSADQFNGRIDNAFYNVA